MGGIFCISSGHTFVWMLPVGRTTSQRLLSDYNPDGNLTINDLDLVSYVVHLHIFVPLMVPLDLTATKVYNTVVD